MLLVSVLTGAPGGGSGMRWWLGDFDGTTFTPEHGDWLDHGRDCYAAVTWNDAPDGRRVMIGWLSNWAYAHDVPSSGWRGAMTLPRDLRWCPPRVVRACASASRPSSRRTSTSTSSCGPARWRTLHGGALPISYDGAAGELVVERAAAAFSEAFASVSRVAVPLVDGGVALTVWLDTCSVEVFADDGRVVLSYLVFPD